MIIRHYVNLKARKYFTFLFPSGKEQASVLRRRYTRARDGLRYSPGSRGSRDGAACTFPEAPPPGTECLFTPEICTGNLNAIANGTGD